MINRQQLELELGRIASGRPNLDNRQGRRSRARWWFTRMHELVEGAREWQPDPIESPTTTWTRPDRQR